LGLSQLERLPKDSRDPRRTTAVFSRGDELDTGEMTEGDEDSVDEYDPAGAGRDFVDGRLEFVVGTGPLK